MLDQAQITYLLRRTEYVARTARVTALMAMPTLAAAVDDILAVPVPPALPTAIDHTNAADQWSQYVIAQQWWFDLMAFDSPRPIQEKMTFFWHGHFTSEWWKINDTLSMTTQNQLYRVNALGNFATLAQAMALQPAMLRYLDNADNTKSSPNQNFARELMELFLLGVGNYTEDDVVAAARAWTGHTITGGVGSYAHLFKAANHDIGLKTFLGQPPSNLDGPDIITIILNTRSQIVARFIVGELWRYFATPVGPQPSALDGIATSFVTSNWDIKAAVKAILLLPDFYFPATMQGLVRTPVDWIVAVMALTGYRGAKVNPQWYTDGMGQTPFIPPNVSGWHPNGAWINTSSMGARADFAGDVVNQLRNDPAYDWDTLIVNAPVANAIGYVATLFSLGPLSATTLAGMTSYLVAERSASDRNDWWQATNLLQMALLAPEMHLA